MIRADERRRPAHRHREAEDVVRRRIARRQLSFFHPAPAAAAEHVSRAGEGRADARIRAAHHRDVATHRDGLAEGITRRAIARHEHRLLCPHGAGAREDIGSTRVQARCGVRSGRPDDGRVALDRHRPPERVGPVRHGHVELLLLAPRRPAAHKDIRRTRLRISGRDVRAGHTHDHRVAAHRDRVTEAITRHPIARDQLRLLIPDCARARKDIRRARAPARGRARGICAENRGVSIEPDRERKRRLRLAAVCDKLGLRRRRDERIDRHGINRIAIIDYKRKLRARDFYPRRQRSIRRIPCTEFSIAQHGLASRSVEDDRAFRLRYRT